MKNKQYLCIDLKSFYASVECVERGLDPMTTNLVVADSERTEKTICLAVTPSLKEYGISSRARLFEVVQKVREINKERKRKLFGKSFAGESCNKTELLENSSLSVSYIVAPPRMAHYIKHSTKIYDIYLKYVAPEDIHVYSIDEVFMDITSYLKNGKLTARQMASKIIKDVFETTGITATAGIGTNMYLAKVAMDIVAKKSPADENGVRIAELDEMTYRKELWSHKPIRDFWRVGSGYSKKLEENRMYTMGDIAKASLSTYGENLLYRLFGVNAELLIDHAWGIEPCTIADVKAYKPENKSIGTGQVLHCPYDFEKARLIVKEMTELLALDLVEKRVVTDQIVLTVGYDIENLKDGKTNYKGEITTDFYGRKVPKHAHGTANIGRHTASTRLITDAVTETFDRCVEKSLLIRRINITACNVIRECDIKKDDIPEQLNFFENYEEKERLEAELEALKQALTQAQTESEKHALIDAEKNALIEAKKQVAQAEGIIAEGEVDLARVTVEPMKKNKRAERRAKRLAKKQAENEAPIPHNKRGKISEKTLDSGTVK